MLSKKYPKCGCEDKHILKDSGTVGVVGPQHKSSTGSGLKKVDTDVQNVDTYLERIKSSVSLFSIKNSIACT